MYNWYDQMESAKAARLARGTSGKGRSQRVMTRQGTQEAAESMDHHDRCMAMVDAIWADFRSFVRNPQMILAEGECYDDIPF